MSHDGETERERPAGHGAADVTEANDAELLRRRAPDLAGRRVVKAALTPR